MKEFFKRGIIGAFIGLFISITISLVISIILGQLSFTRPNPNLTDLQAFILLYVSSLVLGFVFSASSLMFDSIESIVSKTVIHFIILFITMISVSLLNRWILFDVRSILFFFVYFVVIYIGIWFGQYSYWKKQVQEINKRVK